jgi:hypothetical protein
MGQFEMWMVSLPVRIRCIIYALSIRPDQHDPLKIATTEFNRRPRTRKGSRTMQAQQINRLSGRVLIVLSSIALLTVLSGYTHPRQTDEGAGAHIFQLSIVALVPMIFLFLASADWKQPLRNARLLIFPGAALAFAFGALYYLEHYYYR